MPMSGKDMLKRYLSEGWIVLRQKGSHVIVGKGTERETIPMHKELKKVLKEPWKKDWEANNGISL